MTVIAPPVRFVIGGARGPVGPAGPASNSYATTDGLAASPNSNLSATLTEAGKAGLFVLRNAADYSAAIAADPTRQNFIPSTADATKVWVRATILPDNDATRIATSTGTTVDAALLGLQSSKAPLASPAFTGNPTAPTQSAADNSTRLANTAFVKGAIAALVDTAPGTLDTLNELAEALGDDPNFAATMTAALAGKVSTSVIALATGAGLVGWQQAGSGSVLRTLESKARDIIDPRDKGAVMDGTTNDRAAMVAADAVGSVRISKPVYIATSMTFTNPVEIVGNGQIIVPTGQTITLLSGVIAHKRKIFGGAGAIAGLVEAWLEWFANDLKTTGSTVPATDATARIQAAMDSVAGGGTLFAGAGNWRVDGNTAITMHEGQSFWGAGHGPNRGTVFYWPNTTRKLFIKTDLGAGIRGGFIGNFRAQAIDGSATAATSYAIDLNQSDIMVRDAVVRGAYTGVRFNTSYMSRAINVTCLESAYSGFTLLNSIDVFIDHWNVSGDDIMVTTATPTGGAFVLGETVNHPGSSGTITAVYNSQTYRVRWLGPAPAASAAITATGKSGTLLASATPHTGGQIRFSGVNESCVIGRGDGVGGQYGLWVTGAGSAGRIAGNSGYNVIEAGAYFDSTYGGSIMDGAYGFEVNGWFSTTRSQDQRGLALFNCRQITGTPRCENNAGSGIFWDATSKYIYLTPRAVGNGRLYTLGNTADITVSGAATNWSIVGGFAGFNNLAGVSAPKGLYIDNAASGNFSVIGLDVPGGSVVNNCTGDSQYWFAVTGVPWRVDVSNLVNAANDAAASGAGVPKGGVYRNGSVMMVRVS